MTIKTSKRTRSESQAYKLTEVTLDQMYASLGDEARCPEMIRLVDRQFEDSALTMEELRLAAASANVHKYLRNRGKIEIQQGRLFVSDGTILSLGEDRFIPVEYARKTHFLEALACKRNKETRTRMEADALQAEIHRVWASPERADMTYSEAAARASHERS